MATIVDCREAVVGVNAASRAGELRPEQIRRAKGIRLVGGGVPRGGVSCSIAFSNLPSADRHARGRHKLGEAFAVSVRMRRSACKPSGHHRVWRQVSATLVRRVATVEARVGRV